MAKGGGVSGSAAANRGASAMRAQFKQTLQQKTEQSYKTKDDNASTFRDYFNKDKMEGIKLYRVPKGDRTVVLDVIPYFAGDNDPKNKPGDPVYCLDINVHNNIGPMNDKIVCLSQYGKPCPVCEESERRRAAGEDYDSRIKPLKASRRTIYNVAIRDNGDEEKKGIQVFEIAHFFLEKKIAGISKNPRTGGIIVFSDPDEGKSISFTKRNPSKDTVEYSAHQFLDRPAPITDAELNAAYQLDQLINVLSYKEIDEILYATPDETEGGDAEAGKESVPETQAQTQNPPEPAELPARGPARQRPPETPAPEQQGTASGDVCPMGGTMGKNIDEYSECVNCEVYDRCNALAEAE